MLAPAEKRKEGLNQNYQVGARENPAKAFTPLTTTFSLENGTFILTAVALQEAEEGWGC